MLAPFVIHRDHGKVPLRQLRKCAQIVANHHPDVVALLAVYGCGGKFYIAGCTSFDFDKAEHVLIPADQVNFSMMPWRAEVAGNHDVSATAQVEVGVLLTAPAGALMGGRILRVFRGGPSDDAI